VDDVELLRRGRARLEFEMRRFRAEFAPAFRKALADGPRAEDLRAVCAAADARHAELATMRLRDYRIEGLPAQAATRTGVAGTRQSHAADQARRYTTGYRSNAISGLAIVGGPEDRALSTRMTQRKDALAPAAQAAVRAMEVR
jgi:hypothetical protein